MRDIGARVQHASGQLYGERRPPTEQALKNLHGAWFEAIVALVAWNDIVEHNEQSSIKYGIVKLPPAAATPGGFRFWHLFDNDARSKLEQGLFRSLANADMELNMPNPDLVCVEVRGGDVASFSEGLADVDVQALRGLDEKYQQILGKCRYNDIKFGISVKTKLAPDRRYLLAYEGSIFKAITAHLRTRYWNASLRTKYYALTYGQVTSQDRRALSTPTVQTILDVASPPELAVDEIVQCATVEEVRDRIREWLESL